MAMLLMLAGCGSKADSNTVVRVGSLKGPTSIGLVSLMKQNEEGKYLVIDTFGNRIGCFDHMRLHAGMAENR